MTSISDLLGRDKSTLYRELQRNTGLKGYRPKQAHQMAQERSQRRTFTKWTQKVENYVACAVQLDFSPKKISKTMTLDNIEKVSHERIYQFLIEYMNEGGLLYKHLRIKGTNKNKKRYEKKDYRGQTPNRVDIDERPQIVEDRTRIGDWEADLVSGAHHKGF